MIELISNERARDMLNMLKGNNDGEGKENY